MQNNNLEKVRHSLSHLMAQVVMEMWPEAKFAIGPVIANGFGVAILSTSIGLMTNKKAKQMNTGGEIICKVL